MFTILACIREDHDVRLVLLAALVCIVASTTALRFHRRQLDGFGATGLWSLALVGLVGGAGVWATHFVAMLAYETAIAITYDIGLTIASLVFVAAGMAGGFSLATLGPRLLWKILGGVAIGLSVVAMHFSGIAAMRSAFDIQWHGAFVAASVVISILGATAALVAIDRVRGIWQWIAPPLLMVGGIVGLHFTAMAAITLSPNLSAPAVTETIGRADLATVVGGIALLVILAAAIMVRMEARWRQSAMRNLEVAFRGVPTGLAMFDAQGRLVVWNEAYGALLEPFGIRPALGMSRRGLVLQAAHANPALPSGDVRQWADAEEMRRRSVQPQEWPTPEGGWIRAETSYLADGGTLSVVTDISAERSMAEVMRVARDRAEAASRAKSEFLTNMSHEIRTPLNGILGMVQVMGGDTLSDAQRARLKVVRESGDALLDILNDVLDLAKVQSGKLELSLVPTDIEAVCRSCAAGFEGAATVRDLRLMIDIDPRVHGMWQADGLRIRQVLGNLIGNALKFTHEGEVRLAVDITDRGVRFSVSDSGIGIAGEQLEAMFEKFSQADASITRRYGGTGLGLAICRELAELMDGTLVAHSRLGEGSCFVLDLPLQQISRERPQLAAAPGPSGPEDLDRKVRILAADDNITNQLVLRSILEALDCDVTIVGNGLQAVAAAGQDAFDLILMDVQMPEMNGMDATRAIRKAEQDRQGARTPILALTANVMSHQIEAYRAAGMDDCVAKPIDASALLGAINQALAGEALAA